MPCGLESAFRDASQGRERSRGATDGPASEKASGGKNASGGKTLPGKHVRSDILERGTEVGESSQIVRYILFDKSCRSKDKSREIYFVLRGFFFSASKKKSPDESPHLLLRRVSRATEAARATGSEESCWSQRDDLPRSPLSVQVQVQIQERRRKEQPRRLRRRFLSVRVPLRWRSASRQLRVS